MRPTTRQSYEDRILRAWRFLEENLDEDLPLDRLAEVAGFSPFHFHRIFRGMTGESPQSCVRRLRLERAGRALRDSARQVIEIALDAGFDSHEGFDRAFRRQFGASPREFRGGPGVTVRHLPERSVVCMRHTGPYDQVGEAWQRLFAWAGPTGLITGFPELIGIVHDDPEATEPACLRYDAALVVHRPVEGAVTLAEGDYAVLEHRGPYATLGQSYALLCGDWLPQSGREAASQPSLEFYLNNPQWTPPDQLRTEIAVPLV
jgi:AraC family transcriptional regulator